MSHIIGKVYELTKENMNKIISELDELNGLYTKAQAEIERLKKIIAKELTENDELGGEYTYVNCLREEIAALKEKLND